jgi:hypothetical protein
VMNFDWLSFTPSDRLRRSFNVSAAQTKVHFIQII